MGAYDLKNFKFDGKTVLLSEIDAYALHVLEDVMRWGRGSVTVIQGGGRKSSSYSSDTHNKSAFDLTPNSENDKNRILRSIGVMYYIRPAIRGKWERHGHGATLGQPASSASAGLRSQFNMYLGGGNALVGNARDTYWAPINRNVRLQYGARTGKWIARGDAKGWKGAFAQSGDESGDVIKKGQVIENVCTVKCGNRTFLVVSPKAGKLVFYKTTMFNAYVESKIEKINTKYEIVKEPAYGRLEPGIAAKKVVTRKKGIKFNAVLRTKGPDGDYYVATKHGTWYAESSLKKVVAAAPKA